MGIHAPCLAQLLCTSCVVALLMHIVCTLHSLSAIVAQVVANFSLYFITGTQGVIWLGCWLQVHTATGLTVRVINNVVKKMDVKPRFYDAFRKDGYQGTFQFKQKVHSPGSSRITSLLLLLTVR